ncbi:HAD-IIB family hydrolase [Deferribacteres bacterium DY0037]
MLSSKNDGLYVMLISVHGLIRWEEPELGRDSDTGGQVKYVLELLDNLAKHEKVERAELITRQVFDRKVSTDYSVKVEKTDAGGILSRIPFGPNRYLRKERLWPYLDTLVENILRHIKKIGRVPDVIHAHYADAGYVGSQLSHYIGVPLIFTGHSLGNDKIRTLLEKGMTYEEAEKLYNITRRIKAEETALRFAKAVITSTRHEAKTQYADYRNYRPKKIHVMPPGVYLDKFFKYKGNIKKLSVYEKVTRFLDKPEKPLILALSRADDKKNITTLLDAYGQNEELQKAANMLVVAGNREDINTMPAGAKKVLTDMLVKIDKYNLYGKIAYPKTHHSEQVVEFYQLAQGLKGVFVNPALVEPFGLTILEATASGLPVVATNDGGPTEILKNCKNGLLVDPTDSDAMGQAILTAVTDSKLNKQWAASGVANINKFYTWKGHVGKYIKLVERIKNKDRKGYYTMKSASRITGVNRLLVTDIDNTLLGSEEALERFKAFYSENSGKFVFCVATGRHLNSAKEVLKENGVPTPDIFITSVGSEIYYTSELKRDSLWSDHIGVDWKPNEIKKLMKDIVGVTPQPVNGMRDFKISYFYDEQKFMGTRRLTRIFQDADIKAKIIISHNQYLDILPVRASKGLAVKAVAFRWDIPFENILVAGDSGNDTDMLNGSISGVVVGNYSEELEKLKGRENVFFSEEEYADGILDGVKHYEFIK